MNIEAIPAMGGHTVRGQLKFQYKLPHADSYYDMVTIFISKGDSIKQITAKLLQNQNDLPTTASATHLAKAIFYNLKQKTGETDSKNIVPYKGEVSGIAGELIAILKSTQYKESNVYFSQEVSFNIGERDEVKNYIRIMTLVMSYIDFPYIELIQMIGGSITIKMREIFNKDTPASITILKEKMIESIIFSFIKSQRILEAILKSDRMVAIFNELSERKYGFTAIPNAKRIKKKEHLNELIIELQSFASQVMENE